MLGNNNNNNNNSFIPWQMQILKFYIKNETMTFNYDDTQKLYGHIIFIVEYGGRTPYVNIKHSFLGYNNTYFEGNADCLKPLRILYSIYVKSVLLDVNKYTLFGGGLSNLCLSIATLHC